MQLGEEDTMEMLWVNKDEHLVDCDILYYNKFTTLSVDQLKRLQKKGTKIVVDVDDSWELPANHPFYDIWNKTNNTQRVIDNITVADVVICTTLKLQEKVRQYNKNTVVIPNALPFEHDVYTPAPISHTKTTFIYVAGSTHLPDVKLLEGKFKRINSDLLVKNNAEFILAGYRETKIPKYASAQDMQQRNGNFTMTKMHDVWDKMATVFAQTGTHRILPTTDLDSYINYYDQADVALIPLVKNEWNSYKSELKLIEAGCKGIPVICSAVEPYSTLMGNRGIMWVEKPDDWLTHIRYCIKNPGFVKESGIHLANVVREKYNLLQWNEVRLELFKKLMKC